MEGLFAHLRDDLLAGRCTLRKALERLAASEKGRSLAWRKSLATVYSGRPLQECFAAALVAHVVCSQEAKPAGAWQVALRLEREFLLAYGSDPPLYHRYSLRGRLPASGEQGRQVGGPPGAPAEPADATPAL